MSKKEKFKGASFKRVYHFWRFRVAILAWDLIHGRNKCTLWVEIEPSENLRFSLIWVDVIISIRPKWSTY